jgi:predicted ribosomally synthesized peptide with SipW-like signal peptide
MKEKRNVWLSLTIIFVVLGAGIGGTYAYLNAQRTTSQNRFAAGTLDLSVTGSNNVVNEPFVIDNIGETANISGTKTWTVKNTGTLPGRLSIRLSGVSNEENGCNDQEKEVELSCDADNVGELGGVITANVALDGADKVSSLLTNALQDKIGNDWDSLAPVVLPPGSQKTITIHWDTPGTAYGNEVQSDSVKFDVVFRLNQLVSAQ